jgi:hypothetical protein
VRLVGLSRIAPSALDRSGVSADTPVKFWRYFYRVAYKRNDVRGRYVSVGHTAP